MRIADNNNNDDDDDDYDDDDGNVDIHGYYDLMSYSDYY
jgi:hypothetical protein